MRKFFNKRIYLDHAATTPVDKSVLVSMLPYMSEDFGNPGSIYQEGVWAKKALENARKRIARTLSVRNEEIVFTSGGTESNNLAIRGFVEALRREGREYKDMHIITSVVEHQSVLNCLHRLEKDGVQVSYIGVGEDGHVDRKGLVNALLPATILISLMYVNNEIGTITPIRKIVRHLRSYCESSEAIEKKIKMPIVHTDASQAPLYLDCSPERLAVDMLTVDAQKIYGPKGVGFLFKKYSVSLLPILEGGGQENNLRSGTEPVALIVGLSDAFTNAERDHKKMNSKVSRLRDESFKLLCENFPNIKIYGSLTERLANNLNISIPDIDMEFLVLQLDKAGIAVSTGSACDSDNEGSHVISALNLDEQKKAEAMSIRISLGKETTKKEMKRMIAVMVFCVRQQVEHWDR